MAGSANSSHVGEEADIGWFDLKGLEKYASASNRTLRAWIHRAFDPLPASQVGGKLRVKRCEFDRWMERQSVKRVDVGQIVDEIVSSVMQ
jgi:Helix-turn-helix domain